MVKNNHVVNEKKNHLFHNHERKLVQSYLNTINKQLKLTNRWNDGMAKSLQNPKWIELDAKREICEKLLG